MAGLTIFGWNIADLIKEAQQHKALNLISPRFLVKAITSQTGSSMSSLRTSETESYIVVRARTSASPAHHQRDRVAVRHRAAARARDQGRRLQDQGAADGLQAARHAKAAHLAGLRGAVPTPHGLIETELERKRGGSVTIPPGLSAEVSFEDAPLRSGRLESGAHRIVRA